MASLVFNLKFSLYLCGLVFNRKFWLVYSPLLKAEKRYKPFCARTLRERFLSIQKPKFSGQGIAITPRK